MRTEERDRRGACLGGFWSDLHRLRSGFDPVSSGLGSPGKTERRESLLHLCSHGETLLRPLLLFFALHC